MSKLKYTIVKSKKQYTEYCKALEQLVNKTQSKEVAQEIELLTLLIVIFYKARIKGYTQLSITI